MEKLETLYLENGEFQTILTAKFKKRKPYEQPMNMVTAAIPGTIMSVLVKVGQNVKRGDALCVLDSMKMNNTICAADNAVIKNIFITVGESVGKDAPMFEFE